MFVKSVPSTERSIVSPGPSGIVCLMGYHSGMPSSISSLVEPRGCVRSPQELPEQAE